MDMLTTIRSMLRTWLRQWWKGSDVIERARMMTSSPTLSNSLSQQSETPTLKSEPDRSAPPSRQPELPQTIAQMVAQQFGNSLPDCANCGGRIVGRGMGYFDPETNKLAFLCGDCVEKVDPESVVGMNAAAVQALKTFQKGGEA